MLDHTMLDCSFSCYVNASPILCCCVAVLPAYVVPLCVHMCVAALLLCVHNVCVPNNHRAARVPVGLFRWVRSRARCWWLTSTLTDTWRCL